MASMEWDGDERRLTSAEEREEWRKRHMSENGESEKVPITWKQLGTLVAAIISALIAGGTYGNFRAAPEPTRNPASSQQDSSGYAPNDHDAITSLTMQMKNVESSVSKLEARFDSVERRGRNTNENVKLLVDEMWRRRGITPPAPEPESKP